MKRSLYDHCIESDRLALLAQWDTELNGELTPNDVSYGGTARVWWRCEKGHSYRARIAYRSINDTACPVCAGKKVLAGENDLASSFPHIASEWHPTKNEGLLPEHVTAFSNKKVWWQCPIGHEYMAKIAHRTREQSACPYCTGRKILVGFNDLAARNPALAAQWHPELNGDLTPEMVTEGSNAKVWWRCEQGHEWQATVNSRANGRMNGCPYCSGRMLIPGKNDLASKFPDIAAQWHRDKNGALTPEDVTCSSNRKVWWQCELGHEYEARIEDRTSRTYNCPYCSGRRTLPGFNDLASLDPELAEEWHPELNGDLTPAMVTTGARQKVWWQCREGHVWQASVNSRARGKKSGCPVCVRKGDVYGKNILRALHGE